MLDEEQPDAGAEDEPAEAAAEEPQEVDPTEAARQAILDALSNPTPEPESEDDEA